jgi:hypothetical protein
MYFEMFLADYGFYEEVQSVMSVNAHASTEHPGK